MINLADRIKYQDIPKFIIYAMQTQVVSKYGEKPSIPFFVLSRREISWPPSISNNKGEDDEAQVIVNGSCIKRVKLKKVR